METEIRTETRVGKKMRDPGIRKWPKKSNYPKNMFASSTADKTRNSEVMAEVALGPGKR